MADTYEIAYAAAIRAAANSAYADAYEMARAADKEKTELAQTRARAFKDVAQYLEALAESLE